MATLSAFALAVSVIAYQRSHGRKDITKDIANDIQLQRDTVLRVKNPYTNKSCSAQAQLEARTLPNTRLITTFGVNNAFTTQDMKVAAAFKTMARSKLRSAVKIGKRLGEDGKPTTEDTDAQWRDIVINIQNIVREEIDGTHEIVNFAKIVQFITLKISLQYLFLETSSLEDGNAIKYIAKTINILWIKSKNKDTANHNEGGWDEEQRLHHHIHSLTALDPKDPHENPMNLILPAYETMWRAVLRGILEVYFRSAPKSHKWQDTLRDFLHDPDKKTFRQDDSTTTICALDIVKEILRIYPPTRRVNRRFPDDPQDVTRSADIEKCHRNALLVLTGDAEVFRPERWLEIKTGFLAVHAEQEAAEKVKRPNATYKLQDYEEELGYMPFALSCPAGGKVTQGFGTKMIALLVSALCEEFDSLNRRTIDLNHADIRESDTSTP